MICSGNNISGAEMDQAAAHAPGRVGAGERWQIKYDGFRMHACIDGGNIKLLTSTGLDWSHRYGTMRLARCAWLAEGKSAYLDGELCALSVDSLPVFSRCRRQWIRSHRPARVLLLRSPVVNGQSTGQLPRTKRKGKLARLFKRELADSDTASIHR
jgi:bifunctional non-homologous end joining protein LigD